MRSDSLIGYRLEIRITYSNVALKRVNGELFPSRQLKKKAYIPYPEGIGVLRHSYKKVLFDDLETFFINAGHASSLMYLHNSPGLLLVKKRAGL
jgi:hypothetical protein